MQKQQINKTANVLGLLIERGIALTDICEGSQFIDINHKIDRLAIGR